MVYICLKCFSLITQIIDVNRCYIQYINYSNENIKKNLVLKTCSYDLNETVDVRRTGSRLLQGRGGGQCFALVLMSHPYSRNTTVAI